MDGRPGEDIAKERAKAVYETMAGTSRVQEVCERLGISEPRFEQLRKQVVDAALERLTPRRAGRPARTRSPELERIRALEAEVAELNVKLKAALVRAEIAVALPNVVQQPVSAEPTDAPPGPTPRPSRKKNAAAGPEPGRRLRGRSHEAPAAVVRTQNRDGPELGP